MAALDDRNALAQLGALDGSLLSGGPGAHHEQVEVEAHRLAGFCAKRRGMCGDELAACLRVVCRRGVFPFADGATVMVLALLVIAGTPRGA
jgi:hypothetical protein